MEPLTEKCGVFLWDVEFNKEGGSWILRVTIDKEGGLDSETCYKFTELANPILDEDDPIEQSYVFEVSSPGLGRKLKYKEHFEKCAGREVLLRGFTPVEGKKEWIGRLENFDGENVEIDSGGEMKTFVLKNLAFVKLNDDNF